MPLTLTLTLTLILKREALDGEAEKLKSSEKTEDTVKVRVRVWCLG